jgi:hypothetical protein
MELSLLLHYLGTHLGLETLALNNHGVASLKFGDDLVVHLEPDPRHPWAHLYAPLCPLPVDAAAKAALFEPLLMANAFGRGTEGAAFAIDEEHQEIVLGRIFHPATTEPQELLQALQDLVGTLSIWKRRLHDDGFGEAGTGATENPALPSSGEDDRMAFIRA